MLSQSHLNNPLVAQCVGQMSFMEQMCTFGYVMLRCITTPLGKLLDRNVFHGANGEAQKLPSTVGYDTIQYDATRYNMIPCHTIWYDAMQYMIQYVMI